MKPILSLNAYEVGQIIALLPDVAWNRMDVKLRKKLKAVQDQMSNATEDMVNITLASE